MFFNLDIEENENDDGNSCEIKQKSLCLSGDKIRNLKKALPNSEKHSLKQDENNASLGLDKKLINFSPIKPNHPSNAGLLDINKHRFLHKQRQNVIKLRSRAQIKKYNSVNDCPKIKYQVSNFIFKVHQFLFCKNQVFY
jgi:hypothetical protein